MKMLRFEIKKVFSKTKNRITIIVLLVILIATSILTINRVEYVDESGNHLTGISAAKNLREAKNEWSGYLTEDVFQNVLEENRSINNEASSDSIEEENKRFAKKQGISTIRDVINYAFSEYRDYNDFAIDNISDDEASTVYERRISTLKAGLVTLGGKVTTIATVIVPVYAVICLILLPILYKVYKKTEIK